VALRITALLYLLLMTSSSAWSQDQLKRNLFDDCEIAKREFAELGAEQRQPLFEFFTRVIGLSTRSPSAPEAFAVISGAPKASEAPIHPGGKAPDMLGPLWQTTDAKRELRGKRCALELLQIAGADALEALPMLVAIYSEQPLSDEVAVSLEETLALIAERAHKQGLTPSASQFDDILPHLLSPHPLVAQNFAQEFIALATPRILHFMSSRSESDMRPLVAFLQTVDRDGSRAYRSFIDLVPALSEAQVKQLSEGLPLPASGSTSQFVPDLVRLSMTPERTPIFLPILAKVCLASGSIKGDSSLDSRVSRFSFDTSWKTLSVEEASCLINSSTSLGRTYATLFSDHQNSVTLEFAMSVLPLTQKSLQSDTRLQISARLKELALAPTVSTAARATSALRFFPERKSDSLSVAAQNIKRGFDLKDPAQRELLVQASFGLLRGIDASRESAKFAASIIRALESNVARPEAELLAARVPDLESKIAPLLKSHNNSGVRLSALQALSNRATLSKSTLTTIAEMLSQSEFQFAAIHALARGGSASTAILRRAATRGGEGARHAALSALALNGAISKQELAELISSIQNEACGNVEKDIEVVCSASVASSSDPVDREKLASILNRCAESLSPTQRETLISCVPNIWTIARAGLVAVAKNRSSVDSVAPVLAELVASTSSVERDSTLTALLSEGSDSVRQHIAELLIGRRESSNEVRAALRAVANSSSPTSPLYFAVVRTLASIGDAEFSWRAFLEDGIERVGRGEYRDQILQIVPLLPPEMVLQVVVPNLDGEAPERLVGSAIIGAALGTKAVSIVSKVWHLRERRSPAVRYSAILALLQINPLTPDISDFVERVLVNRHYGLAKELPINWSQTVAVVDLDKSRFGTLRTVRLEQLLAASPAR
jgi:hypothetical protein